MVVLEAGGNCWLQRIECDLDQVDALNREWHYSNDARMEIAAQTIAYKSDEGVTQS